VTADPPAAEIIAWLDSDEGQAWQAQAYGQERSFSWTRTAFAWLLPARLFSTEDYESMSGPLNPEYDPSGPPPSLP
jgi:hypothetical protein